MTDDNLRQALRDCYLPTGRNLLDAGLLKSAHLTPDLDAPGHAIPGVPTRHIATLQIYAPGRDDAANAQLAAQIENRLLGIQAISQVQITLLPALFPIL